MVGIQDTFQQGALTVRSTFFFAFETCLHSYQRVSIPWNNEISVFIGKL